MTARALEVRIDGANMGHLRFNGPKGRILIKNNLREELKQQIGNCCLLQEGADYSSFQPWEYAKFLRNKIEQVTKKYTKVKKKKLTPETKAYLELIDHKSYSI
jgi:hypothetical protein